MAIASDISSREERRVGWLRRSMLRLPVLRLPTALFPREALSLALTAVRVTSPPLTPALAREAIDVHGGRVAAVADGQRLGVVMQVLDAGSRESDLLHVLGLSERCVLHGMGERSAAGWRMGEFEAIDDSPLDGADAQRLAAEAARAYTLLEEGEADGSLDLTPCTLEEELNLWPCNPSEHPFWREASALPPQHDAAALSLHLAARLPLTTAVRLHVLGCPCPLKRMMDVVDAMRALSRPEARGGGGRYATAAHDERRLHKFTLVYDTAEASGCELEPPRAVVDWARF